MAHWYAALFSRAPSKILQGQSVSLDDHHPHPAQAIFPLIDNWEFRLYACVSEEPLFPDWPGFCVLPIPHLREQ